MTADTDQPTLAVLKPCPFCNWPAKLHSQDGIAWAECIDCACEGPPEDTAADAIAAWNTRTSSEPRPAGDLREAERLVSYLFGTDRNTNGPRVVDLCFTAFMGRDKPNPEDGGKSDWFTDTKPNIDRCIAVMKDRLLAALATHSPAPMAGEGWQDIETVNRDCMTEIDMWCASAEADGEGWNLRGILMIGTPDWIKREDASDYFPHENGGFLTHWRPLPAPPAAAHPSTQGV